MHLGNPAPGTVVNNGKHGPNSIDRYHARQGVQDNFIASGPFSAGIL